MTTEEKAKAYNKALEMAKNVLETDLHESGAWTIQKIFPQLKESEDERMIEQIKFAVMQMPSNKEDTKKECLAWLEKQKERKQIEWSEEDENKLNHILEIVHIASGRDVSVDEKEELESFLKSLRPQSKEEWSEDDERMLSRCIKSVECSKQFADSKTYKAAKDVEMNWLKSLRPQPKQD